ncbi:hypothetical protein ACIA5C_48295 [Actinoplanes sp. NPDC051343]|uniref:hypothetical protein n=1 Tax=Actinoplanes sp. NPDC051343 TaxID=3363906 RepID=UPI0037B9AEEB
MRRLKEGTFSELMALLPLVTKAMRRALADPEVEPKTQFAAAAWLAEQLLGKARQRVSIDALSESPETQARNALASAIVLDDGRPQGHLHQVIDGDLVEYDDNEREAEQETDILE